MTIEMALKGINICLDGKKRLVENLRTEYAKYPEDMITGLCNTLLDVLETDIEFLAQVKNQITQLE